MAREASDLAPHVRNRPWRTGEVVKVACCSWFLLEGFRSLGCEVLPFALDADRTLDEQIEALNVDPDVVLIEFFGQTELPRDLHKSRHRLAAYCIDSPLNEFWFLPLSKLFDHVYVDQLSSVAKFRRQGVEASWLPLCVFDGDFREPPAAKEHFLTFVGRLTPERVKRNNLIRHVREQYPLHLVQDVPRPAMLDFFAASRAVLNENFFSGLNLRFLQALASGSLLLTERGGCGVGRFFREGEHYLGYSPDNLLPTLEKIQQAPEAFADLAARGQELCRRKHTSRQRAAAVLDDLARDRVMVSLPDRVAQTGEALARYNLTRRFGGSLAASRHLLEGVGSGNDEAALEACRILGVMHLRLGQREAGVEYLEKGAASDSLAGLRATLHLLLAFVEQERFFIHLAALTAKLVRLGLGKTAYLKRIKELRQSADRLHDCCLLGYELLFDAREYCALGFAKKRPEQFPDYAMEYAVLAFGTKPTPQALAAIIRCSKKAGVGPEALPALRQAIAAGIATDEQIALSAALAVEYYDFSYARIALAALKQTLRKRGG
jgi:hypothetical protein